MNVSQKLELFQTLVKCGFKEIEVGFPSASNTEFAFNRRLIEENRAPDDVWLQVLVQAREDLIERTVESLMGAKKAIIHLYNSTSPAQRRVVFGKSKEEIKPGRRARREMDQGAFAPAQGHGGDAPVFAGKFQRDGSGVCQGDFRSGDGRVAADAAAQDDFESAGHGRGRDAECLCGPDRMDVPQHQEPRFAHHQLAHAQRPLHGRGRDGARACSRARIAWKARCSAMANARAISIS